MTNQAAANNTMSQLRQLQTMTTVVADTGDIESIKQFKPEDATTNPSLILKAVQLPVYGKLLDSAIDWAKRQAQSRAQQIALATDKIAVLIGREILQVIPGKISTEVDARLSFDKAAMVEKARQFIDLYQQAGVDKKRVLIKLASTWEGIRAAEILEQEGIHCNLTLLFNFAQARACAEAGVYLISPFVGRILDWHKKHLQVDAIAIEDDPGVASVKKIYQFYKQQGYPTIVMGASFRSKEQVLALAGCDRLTISPDLLAQLSDSQQPIQLQLKDAGVQPESLTPLDEKSFRWQLNEDAMATEKLAEGIRQFAADQRKLEALIDSRL